MLEHRKCWHYRLHIITEDGYGVGKRVVCAGDHSGHATAGKSANSKHFRIVEKDHVIGYPEHIFESHGRFRLASEGTCRRARVSGALLAGLTYSRSLEEVRKEFEEFQENSSLLEKELEHEKAEVKNAC